MSKVLVESPRVGRARARAHVGVRRCLRQRPDRDGESAPQRLGMQRDIRAAHKHFGEHLAPLYRWLRRQVHRPWDKVWSELCAQLDRRSVVQAHLFEHIRDEVERETLWHDDAVWFRGWRGHMEPMEKCHATLFVHPRTGILLPNRARQIALRRQREAPRAEAHPDRRTMLPGRPSDTQWHRLDGEWFEVRLGTLDVNDTKTSVYDVVLRRPVHGGERELLRGRYGRSGVYAIAKRQLGHKELRAQGLA